MSPDRPLEVVVPGQLWHAQQPLRFGPLALSSRMTVMRRQDGTLWVHSPIQPTPALRSALDALGQVTQVVAPNRSHHLYFLPFLEEFPAARGYVAPGLARKRPDLAAFPTLDGAAAEVCGAELLSVFVEGLPVINETVWFHESSGTLILTDLLFCFSRDGPALTRRVARALGVLDTLAMSRTMRWMVRDRAALRGSVERLLALDLRRVVVAHDRIVEHDAKAQLQRAFAWLTDRA